MLGFIDPRFNGTEPEKFDAEKFGGKFAWGMNAWAGIAGMIWNAESHLAREFDGPTLSFDWSSGKLWQERSGENIRTSCPATMKDLKQRLKGEAGTRRYIAGTNRDRAVNVAASRRSYLPRPLKATAVK
jgi:hypothetical protein